MLKQADKRVRITKDDAVSDYLEHKLVSGPGVTLTKQYPGEDEHLRIGLSSGGVSYTQSWFSSSNDYVETLSSSWIVILSFYYPGSAEAPVSAWKIIASRNGSNGTALARLYDFTNAAEVGRITWTSAGKAIYDDLTLANLPTGPAIFEIQFSTGGPPSSSARLHSSLMI